ncbi:ATP-binding protein [Streptomyces canus]|uniref:ATP-binding protein n=1 Tax=Streptomyces canus TaxID=58343 RepID=UPI0036785B35
MDDVRTRVRVQLAGAHLTIRLQPLHRALRAAARRVTGSAAASTVCVAGDEAERLLDRIDELALFGPYETQYGPAALTGTEQTAQLQLRRQAVDAGLTLPFDEIVGSAGLGPLDQDALLLVSAPELHPAYERLYAYVLDNLNLQRPCARLLCALGGDEEVAERRAVLGATGTLRRHGLVRDVALAEDADCGRRALAPAPGLVEYLLGAPGDPGLFLHDPGAVALPSPPLPLTDQGELDRLGKALGTGCADLVAVWGLPDGDQLDAVAAIAAAAGTGLRRLPEDTDDIDGAFATAAALRALLWVPTATLRRDTDRQRSLVSLLARTRTPVCLTGTTAWHPGPALGTRRYAHLHLADLGFGDAQSRWAAALPGVPRSVADTLAGRYRLGADETRTAVTLARTAVALGADDRTEAVHDHMERAVAAVTGRGSSSFVRSVRPRRDPDDLVLPAAQLAQLREIADAFRDWPRLADRWGMRGEAAGRGVKAMFTGPSGTGKSLSAEVVAKMLGLDLLVADLAGLVSKWVGETEQNLDAVFTRAEQGRGLLLLDEADVLLGKRGAVRHGSDRYANLEAGYLLQRLEESDALVVVTSNLRENIDPAFTRRFHYVVDFPKPRAEERHLLWRRAFPPTVPLAQDVDLDRLAALDMTGASIMAAARSAALLTAGAGLSAIGMAQVAAGVSRQFQREARLLHPEDLGLAAAAGTAQS